MLALLFSPSALAKTPEDAQTYLTSIGRLYESLEYERALDQIKLARQLPRDTEQEVTLSLYEGVILAELGQREQSSAAFKSALLLRPQAPLPVKVSPKVEKLFESTREQVVRELAATTVPHKAEKPQQPVASAPLPAEASKVPAAATPAVSSHAPETGGLRRHVLIPALAGGALTVAGGISWAVSRGELSRLRNADASLQTAEDVQHSISRGRTWQTVGISLLSVGAAGLATATGLYVLGAPDAPVALGMGTDGTSAFVYGRWK